MAASDLVASTVMNMAASLMNDTARTVYTYAAQVPYLQMAIQELREIFELNGIPAAQEVSAVIAVPIGQTILTYNAITSSLPSDFVEPLQVWERQAGVDPYVPMTRRDFIPHNLTTPISNFGFYTWNSMKLEVPASNQANEIKIDYIKQLFPPIVDQTSIINVVNGATFLEFRTAGLMAEFIERNIASANSFNTQALLGLDRVTGISIRTKQTIFTRRRPFRRGYKVGGWVG